jgi:hypothetical protein
MARRKSWVCGLWLTCLVLIPLLSEAQEPQGGQGFRLMAPGARALGMGGGFFAVADDATAAATNPAGLALLDKAEVSAELRAKNATTSADFMGESTQSFVSPSFASLVFPGKRLGIAFFYNEPVRYDFDAEFSVEDDWDYMSSCSCNVVHHTESMMVRSAGVAVVARLHDRLSIGVSAAAASVTDSFRVAFVDRARPNPANSFGWDGQTTVPHLNAGLLVNPGGKVALGVGVEWLGDYEVTQYDNRRRLEYTSTQSLPTSPYLGVALRPSSKWTISAGAKSYQYGTHERQDEAEAHVGLEYTTLLGGSTPLSIRAGAFGQDSPLTDDIETNGTFGVGIVLGGRVQLDGAVSIGMSATQGLLSCVVWF